MKVAEKKYVAIDYCLTLDSGEEVDRSQAGSPLGFITGTGQIIPGLEKQLMGMAVGDSAKITVEPEDAYGLVNDELQQDVPRSHFPTDVEVEVGMSFQADGPHGPFMVVVKSISDDTVTVDLNHPMAGKRLLFDIKVVEVRDASDEELAGMNQACGCGCGDEQEKSGGCGSGCNCG